MAICDNIWGHWNLDQAPPGPFLDNSSNGLDWTSYSSGIQREGVIVNSLENIYAGESDITDPLFDATGNNPFTISFWFYPTWPQYWGEGDKAHGSFGVTPGPTVSLIVDTSASYFIRIEVFAGDLYVKTEIPILGSFLLDWHHFTVRYTGTQLITTMDDVVVDTTTGSTNITWPGEPHSNSVEATSDTFHPVDEQSRIDECAVWSRSLTDEEITWLFNSGSGNTFECSEEEEQFCGNRISPKTSFNRIFPYEPLSHDNLIPRIFPIPSSNEGCLIKSRTYQILTNLLVKRKVIDPSSSIPCGITPDDCLPEGGLEMSAFPDGSINQGDIPVGDIDIDDCPIADIVCKINLGI